MFSVAKMTVLAAAAVFTAGGTPSASSQDRLVDVVNNSGLDVDMVVPYGTFNLKTILLMPFHET